MPLHIRNGLVLSSAHGSPERADVLIEGRSIVAVGADLRPPDGAESIDASGRLLVPGFINAHTHGRENLLKGLVDNRPLEEWLFQLAALSDDRTPEDQYVSVALGAIEMVKHGVTSAYEVFTHIPVVDAPAIAAVVKAYSDVGLRAIVAPAVSDIPFHHSIPGLLQRLDSAYRSELDRLFPLRDGRLALDSVAEALPVCAGNELVRLALSPVIPERCSHEFLIACRDFAERHELPIHTHLLETRLQAIERHRRDNCTTPELLDRLGLLTPKTSLAHAVWVTDQDIELISRRECAVIHNPLSNLKLGSGFMPMKKMRQQNVKLAIGTDGCASADHQNMFEATRLAAYVHRPSEDDYEAWPRSEQVLHAAWEGGAHAMGLDGKLGRIAPGYLADISILDLNSEALTPLNNATNQLVFCENGTSVRTVIVNGRIVLENGEPTLIDADQIKARARDAAQRLTRNARRAQILLRAEPAVQAARLTAFASHR